MYSNVFIIHELSLAQQWHGISMTFELEPSQATAV